MSSNAILSDGTVITQTSDAVGPANTTSATDTSTVNAPVAGTVIATVALQPGTYDIECITFIGGTTVASLEPTNMRLVVGAALIGRIMNPVPGTSGGIGTGQLRVRYVLNAAANAQIVAVSNATAASVYSGSIVAKRVA